MSIPGKAEGSSQDDKLSKALKPIDDSHPTHAFHKDSYMKDLKQISQTLSNPDVPDADIDKEFENQKDVLEEKTKRLWDHSKIYSWVNKSTETKAFLNNKEIRFKLLDNLLQFSLILSVRFSPTETLNLIVNFRV